MDSDRKSAFSGFGAVRLCLEFQVTQADRQERLSVGVFKLGTSVCRDDSVGYVWAASSNRCHASSNKCLTNSNNKAIRIKSIFKVN